MRAWFRSGLGVGLFSFVVFALLVVGIWGLAKPNVLSDEGPMERVASFQGEQEEVSDESAAAERAALENDLLAAKAEAARESAREEPAPEQPVQEEPAGQTSASASASAAPSAVPADTTMYLTVPSIGLYDIPVFEGTSEAVLSQGVGHVPGTGYPWLPGSNTYIAGHRIGYPGTVSDHVFWDLPSLGVGDQVIIEDSLGQAYTYQVSEILEVHPTDLSVTAAAGRDMVSLQTCTENFGDYWTPGPNWLARYIVRADRVA